MTQITNSVNKLPQLSCRSYSIGQIAHYCHIYPIYFNHVILSSIPAFQYISSATLWSNVKYLLASYTLQAYSCTQFFYLRDLLKVFGVSQMTQSSILTVPDDVQCPMSSVYVQSPMMKSRPTDASTMFHCILRQKECCICTTQNSIVFWLNKSVLVALDNTISSYITAVSNSSVFDPTLLF